MTRIVICVRNRRDREHLAQWLPAQHEVISSENTIPREKPFDLCIIDAHGLQANRELIQARREAERPVFLPFLLVARRRQVVKNRSALLAEVDDVIWAPVAKAELSARIVALLRIRNLARLVQQRYISLANQSGAAVLVVSAGRIRYANEAARGVFSTLPSEGSGASETSIEELVDPEYRRIFGEYVERIAARARGQTNAAGTPEPTHVEVRLNTAEERWAHVSAAPTFEDDDREFLYMMLDVTESKLQERELRESRRRIQSLAGQLVSAEQRERGRLAGDIHDGVNQSLASLRMRLDLLTKAPDRLDLEEELGDMRRILDEAITQTRSLIVELDPPTIRESGLARTLSWLTERFRDSHGLEVTFEGEAEHTGLPEDLQHVLYRATRELLFNVLKHAPGAQARVSFRETETELHITVADDGPGFDPQSVSPGSGFGLFSLCERLRPFDGVVEINSAPGNGTVVEQRIPLPSQEETHAKAHTAR
jgi:signal transduction histidine kinase